MLDKNLTTESNFHCERSLLKDGHDTIFQGITKVHVTQTYI